MKYYLLGEDGTVNLILKSPHEMMKEISVDVLPHLYKLHYFHLVYEHEIFELKNKGLIDGDVYTQEIFDGANAFKDIMETAIIKTLGDDVLNFFKEELESGWKTMFKKIDNNLSDETKEEADRVIEEHGYNLIDGNEHDLPKTMFP